MGNNCVFWHRASCLCSLHSDSLRGFYDLSVTLFLSLIYRFHLMFSILACPRIFLFARLLQMVLVVRVRLFLCKAFTCCMLGSVSTLMCHSNEPLLRISGQFTVTGYSSYTPPPPYTHLHLLQYCQVIWQPSQKWLWQAWSVRLCVHVCACSSGGGGMPHMPAMGKDTRVAAPECHVLCSSHSLYTTHCWPESWCFQDVWLLPPITVNAATVMRSDMTCGDIYIPALPAAEQRDGFFYSAYRSPLTDGLLTSSS